MLGDKALEALGVENVLTTRFYFTYAADCFSACGKRIRESIFNEWCTFPLQEYLEEVQEELLRTPILTKTNRLARLEWSSVPA